MHLKDKTAKVELELEQVKQERDKIKSEYDTLNGEKEEMEAQINGLKNKVKCLVMENEKLSCNGKGSPPETPHSRSMSMQSEGSSPTFPGYIKTISIEEPNIYNGLSLNVQAEIVKGLEEEVKLLREQNKKLSQNLES
jgi:hypothetical protein